MHYSQNDKLKVAQIYDNIAESYEERTTPLTYFQAAVREFLLENVHAGQRVLDLGCGPGHLTSPLPLDVEVVGLDISTAMVDAARRKRPTGTYLVHDFHQPLPAELGKFDAIVANGCFDFCENLVQVIDNVSVALAYGGRFFFTINERRAELPFHDARWIDAGGGQVDIRMFFWSFSETAAAIETLGLRPLTYRHAPGWENETLQTTIYYGYWVVEHLRTKE
ncbi:methyltransferase family protein [Paenibacillus cellulosilyticus]|uniref:Methyltransferase family protein n=1 Tax=Paenibacillus cellulosilyticus TaxID=375489 RepID=A0A2V2Z0I2_9BACL|nr:class I SAM-dependent methyltransferase [Paenibacillus cellulosilyticus]PWW08778.1 methyltransferase family protein [Paenibacillus cellulosilyticus]QKS48333.1 class I SAM-dependent methyltransferase [Paenibacillus cellulosilyticus]